MIYCYLIHNDVACVDTTTGGQEVDCNDFIACMVIEYFITSSSLSVMNLRHEKMTSTDLEVVLSK